jgi:hypothetical protein
MSIAQTDSATPAKNLPCTLPGTTAPAPVVQRWVCTSCQRRWWGQPLLRPACPACGGRLRYVETWNLTRQGWPGQGEVEG